MRRYIEIKLRELAIKNQLHVEKIYSLNQLIDLLFQKRIIEYEDVKNLKYPIFISNKAVHGQDTSHGIAEEAIFHAARAVEHIIYGIEN